jgi:hypothetical protein
MGNMRVPMSSIVDGLVDVYIISHVYEKAAVLNAGRLNVHLNAKMSD